MSHECKLAFIECATHTDILVCLFAICAHTKLQDERDLSCQVVKLSGYCQSGCHAVRLSGFQGAVRCGLTGLTAELLQAEVDQNVLVCFVFKTKLPKWPFFRDEDTHNSFFLSLATLVYGMAA